MTDIKQKIELIERKRLSDERGWFLKVINGKEEGLPDRTGEVYIVHGKPGNIRGGHYHKLAHEWFTLIEGEATLNLCDTESGERLSINFSADKPVTIHVPPFIAHQFESLGESEFTVIAYTDVLYDPSDTIAFKY
jgi:dTDP-4-dehydrorhamnose 3,5-epimerase-like enzyme